MSWELHAGEGGEAPEPWVSKSGKLHAGILSPSSGSNPERLRVTLQGVLSLLSHTSLPGQAFSWLQLSFLWTSSPLGYIQQCRQLFTAAPGLLFLSDTSVLSFSFELTLPRRHYTFPWESFHLPSCPSPLWCSPRPAFTLGSAFLDSVVFSSGSSWWPITAALLTWMKAYVTPIPTSLQWPRSPKTSHCGWYAS